MNKRERYLRNQERMKGRAIASILRKQKQDFVDFLEKKDKSSSFYEKKEPEIEATVDVFIATVVTQIPDYLSTSLPPIMKEGAREPISRYSELLPTGYSLAFNVETSPASNYIRDLYDLMISNEDGSITKTTRDELRRLLSNGIDEGMSYGEIAKQIQETDPFVFSKYRAKLIAVNEVGRAYGWANHEPGRELVQMGYVLQKSWTTSHDDKVRPTHVQNERQGWVDFNGKFSGTEDEYAPSSNDINCRCTSSHRVVGVRKGLLVFDVRTLGMRDIKKLFLQVRSKSSL